MAGGLDSGDGSGDSSEPGKWLSPSISSGLVGKFLTSENKIRLGALTSAVTGGSLYAILVGPVSVTLSIGKVWQKLSSIPASITFWAGEYVGSFADLSERFWDPWTIDFGFFALPMNLLVVLVLLSVAAWGVSTWRGD